MTTSSKTRTGNSTKPPRRSKKSSLPPETIDFRISSRTGKTISRTIDRTVRSHDLIPGGSRVLVAFSGGPDSTALLHFLLSMRKKRDISLGCVHVNYGLRGKDSDLDEKLVRKYCQKHDIPLFAHHVKTGGKWNEESLRNERYRFFESVRTKHRYDIVATAHTKNDQAETVLMRILRGTGPEGLSGIPFKRDSIIRPLLDIPKEALIEFLSCENLSFRNDRTNFDEKILRNRVRHELIPLIERKYQKNIRDILSRMAQIFSEQRVGGDVEVPFPHTPEENGFSFSRNAFLALKERRQSEILRSLFLKVTGMGTPPGTAFVREAKKCIGSGKNKVRTLTSKRLKIEVRGDTVVMLRS